MSNIRRILAALVAVVAMTFMVSSPSWADMCTSFIVDEPGLLGGNTGKIDEAAKKLPEGTSVYVRIISDYGSAGSLRAYEQALVANCPTWQSASGDGKNNFVAVFIETAHRKAELFWGSKWDPALNSTGQSIFNSMKPDLSDGDFESAIAVGIAGMAREIEKQLNPPTPTTGPTTIINEAPTDLSGVSSAIMWLAGLGALFFAVFLLIKGFGERRAENEKRSAAQLRVKALRDSCASRINAFELRPLSASVNTLVKSLGSVNPDLAKDLREKFESLERYKMRAETKFATLEEQFESSLTAGKSVKEYDAIKVAYDEADAIIGETTSLQHELEAVVTQIESDAKNAASLTEVAEQALTRADAVVETLVTQGFKIPAELTDVLANARSTSAEARSELEKNPLAASNIARLASEKADAAILMAESLTKKKASVEAEARNLSAQLDKAITRTKRTRRIFEDISKKYAQASWTTIAGNGTEAEKRMGAAATLIKAATSFATMKQQEWAQASAASAEAGKLLAEADMLLEAIETTAASIIEAEGRAVNELKLADADIKTARQYIASSSEDFGVDFNRELERADALLTEAQTEARQAKPDFISVVRMALAANRAADTILERAQNERESRERKRRQLQSLRAEVVRSLDAATRYISVHASVVGKDAERLLKSAVTSQTRASSSRNIDTELEHLTAADKAADEALRIAQSDVASENRRITARKQAAERRRRNDDDSMATGIIVGTTIGSSSRSDSWGSSGSNHHSSGGSLSGNDSSNHSSFGSGFDGGSSHNSAGGSW